VREAVFNILGREIEEAHVLDLFAGTGAYGIEALSRGATFATFVENSRAVAGHISRTIRILELEAASLVLCMDAPAAITRFASDETQFDVIFIDPPYSYDLAGCVLANKSFSTVVKTDGIVVAESGPAGVDFDSLQGFRVINEKKYGDTVIAVIQKS
jgi:16S rRNA (guanine966-N2)-methyltransferase